MRAYLFGCHEDDLSPLLEMLDGEYFKGGLQLGPQHLLVPMPVHPEFGPHNQLADQLRQLLRHNGIEVYPVLIPPEEAHLTHRLPSRQVDSNLWIRARTDRDFGLIENSQTRIWEGIQFELTGSSQPLWAGLNIPDQTVVAEPNQPDSQPE